MSKWPDCPIVACKNDLCHTECQALKYQKDMTEAVRFWDRIEAERKKREAMLGVASPVVANAGIGKERSK